jgi:hypothetical protein
MSNYAGTNGLSTHYGNRDARGDAPAFPHGRVTAAREAGTTRRTSAHLARAAAV